MLLVAQVVFAQDKIVIESNSEQISENFELEAAVNLFAESENVEEFEKKLNDPEIAISNLDLNQDGNVDYLRVLEIAEGENRVLLIQSIIGKDQFQDVATIEIFREKQGKTRVQVVGDPAIYGRDFIIEPVFVYRPAIYTWFWSSFYRPWYSPYYYDYYPNYYSPYRVCNINIYHNKIYKAPRYAKRYYYPNKRVIRYDVKKYSRKDYFASNPQRKFENKNKGVKNYNYTRRTKPSNSEVSWNSRSANSTQVHNTNRVVNSTRNSRSTETPKKRVVKRTYTSTRTSSNSYSRPKTSSNTNYSKRNNNSKRYAEVDRESRSSSKNSSSYSSRSSSSNNNSYKSSDNSYKSSSSRKSSKPSYSNANTRSSSASRSSSRSSKPSYSTSSQNTSSKKESKASSRNSTKRASIR
jgi:hypothetical protein